MKVPKIAKARSSGLPSFGISNPLTVPGKKPFYQCQRCANCCKWPGEVVLTQDEVVQIADFLDLPIEEFTDRFTKLRANRQGLTLIEKPNHECVFLEGINCAINEVKPEQCRGFPNTWNFPGWRQVCEAIPVDPDDRLP